MGPFGGICTQAKLMEWVMVELMAPFGNTGLSVSRIGYGGMELSGPPRSPYISREQAVAVLRAAVELGINYFDTSIDYGSSEEVMGIAFQGMRDKIVLASKCGCAVGVDGKKPHVYTYSNIKAGVAQSLQRLRTDYIDVMQIHGNPTRRELESQGGLEALMDLKKEGVIGHVGLSSRKPFIEEFLDLDFLSVFQLPYSAIQRQHEDVVREVGASRRALVARGVVGRGSVAKEWSSIPVGMEDGQARGIWESAQLDELLGGKMTRIEFMVRFALSLPEVTTCLTGTTNIDHLKENVMAAEKGPLEPKVYDLAVERLTAAGSRPGDANYSRGGPKPPVETRRD